MMKIGDWCSSLQPYARAETCGVAAVQERYTDLPSHFLCILPCFDNHNLLLLDHPDWTERSYEWFVISLSGGSCALPSEEGERSLFGPRTYTLLGPTWGDLKGVREDVVCLTVEAVLSM